jgi:hypothetical protein
MADPMRVGLSAWTEIGWVEIDSATAGFGDDACRSVLGNRLLELHLRLTDPDARVIDFTHYGVPLIAFSTMADGTYPVELARDPGGRLLAARICLTTDVDELEGVWRPVGAVPITSATCIAADPFIDREMYQRSFPCPNGLFPVEVFEWRDPEEGGSVDRLGIRIRFEHCSALDHGERSQVRASGLARGSEGGWADPDRS